MIIFQYLINVRYHLNSIINQCLFTIFSLTKYLEKMLLLLLERILRMSVTQMNSSKALAPKVTELADMPHLARKTQERGIKYEDYGVLLLQIDSEVGSGQDNGIRWGDSGTANFFIRPEGLKNLDFNKVLFAWVCG